MDRCVMANFNDHTYIAILISRLFTGTATDEEKKEVEEWRKKQEGNERLFEELSGFLFWEEKKQESKKMGIAGAYLKVMEKRRRNHNRRIFCRVSAVAASLTLILTVGTLFFLESRKSVPEVLYQAETKVTDSILPGGVKAELRLADGSTVRLNGNHMDSLPEQPGSAVVAGNKGVSYEDKQPMNELVYNTLRIPRGGEYSLTLGDGTVVYLNSETELRYPVQFIGEERRVFLSGEAYFEVKRNEEKPFIVETAHSKVEVLGTSFNLRSYSDEEKVAATLVEGKVRLVADNNTNINLLPGEQGIVDQMGRLTKREVDTYIYTAWKDGNFVFRKQPLEEVMRIIARWYDVNVYFIHASQRNISFSGNVKRYDDFEKILEMLQMTGSTRFEVNNKDVFIREK